MRPITIIPLLGALSIAPISLADESAHWGYSGDAGPEDWGNLAAEYALCGAGRNQSPVDLSGFIEAELPAIAFDYTGKGTEILNNGHTVQVNYAGGDTLGVDGEVFELEQLHFHTPSENHNEGRSFPMEAHLVHADEAGNLVVVAVLFEAGELNEAIAALWAEMPENAGDKHPLQAAVVAADLLPPERDYYRFSGSLTTPPCSEGVRWLVMKQALVVSDEQVQAFAGVMHHPNNRPLQPLYARRVLR